MTNDLNLHPNFIPRYRVIGSHSLPNWIRRRWVALAIPVQILFGGRWPRGGDPSPRSVFVSSSPSEPITAAPRHALYFAKLRFLPRQTQHGYALDNQVYDWESRGEETSSSFETSSVERVGFWRAFRCRMDCYFFSFFFCKIWILNKELIISSRFLSKG